jgi:hypothetical protein
LLDCVIRSLLQFGMFQRSTWLILVLEAAYPLAGQTTANSCAKVNPTITFADAEITLRAWLPREFWRKHQLSYRLLLKTAAGVCATEVFDDEE